VTEFVETPIPGLGVRYTMTTRSDRAVGVVIHHTGRRDLVVYDRADPDAAEASVELTEEEGRALGDLLGGSRIVERLSDLTHHIEGLVIEWIRIDDDAPVAGIALAEAEIRADTGASVVALVHGEDVVPAPGGDDRLTPGATAVVVGSTESVEAVRAILAPSASAS